MCGIFALLSKNFASKYSKEQIVNSLWKIKGRGPDATSYINVSPSVFMGFHRLSINDTSMSGMQPFVHKIVSSNGSNTTETSYKTTDNIERIYANVDNETTDEEYKTPILETESFDIDEGMLVTQCNGEIYNSFELGKKFGFKFSSTSDCEVIPHLYKHFNGDVEKVCHALDGVFAFVIYDKNKDILVAGRDPIGVRPLFIGYDKENESVIFASEGKAIVPLTSNVEQFQPGSWWSSEDPTKFHKWWNIIDPELSDSKNQPSHTTKKEPYITNEDEALLMIRENLCEATRKRLMSDRPIGCFLSGGLDSSLITALVNRLNPYTVNTYAIGMNGATDLFHAEKAAKHIGTNHHNVVFTAEEGINAVEEVIYCLETYDITTIRASVGMYLLSKHITENTNDIVIYSGEGSDEVTQGYLYFHNSPTPNCGDLESQRLINNLHYFDVKRVDRTVSDQGLEVRVPFLDKTFVKNYFKICPELRRPHYKGVEKYLVRKAFDNEIIKKQEGKDSDLINLLPESILWRTKEAFSDGVSSLDKPWYQLLGEYVEKHVSDEEYNNARQKFKDLGLTVPISKESYYYRKIYQKYFGDELELIPYYWMPQWSDTNDPSARTIKKYQELIKDEKEQDLKVI